MAARRRIAVLGGGLGSLATLFHLTEQPDWREQFDITLYQQGWRLGGKCASGRDQRPEYGNRVLEHGLHLFGGFYNYSFGMLDRCYKALNRPEGHPNRHVWDAFTGLDGITLMDRTVGPTGEQTFDPWMINFEMTPGQPGDVIEPPSTRQMIVALVRLASMLDPALRPPYVPRPGENFFERMKEAAEHALLLLEEEIIDTTEAVIGRIIGLLGDHSDDDLSLDSLMNQKWAHRLRMAYFLIQTVLHGIIFDGVLKHGFDPLDEWELKDWIRRHGLAVAKVYKKEVKDPIAAANELADWAVIHGSYDYVFGYADGDPTKPAQGAGTALRGLMRLATGYHGHLFYAMRGGMGDVVVAPLYEVLARRGVRFEFFHRVERLVPDGTGIAAIEISRQAKVKGGRYQPLIPVQLPGWPADKPLPCWPSQPLWDQIEDADQLTQTDFEAPWSPALGAPLSLQRGKDFDEIVLGIPLGELRRVCAELPEVNSNWGRMFGKLTTTRTIAAQLWFTRTNEDLGYATPGRTLTGNAQPLSCWADMSHLLSRETWKGDERPQSIAYFCGQLRGEAASSAEEAADATAEAQEETRLWLLERARTQWPQALGSSPFGLDPNVLHDPENRRGDARFQGQYFRANVTPSEMYVQYPPGSVDSRMRANESGFENLYLCGDWTKNGINAGAAEAAVMSGVICANSLMGDNRPIPGERDRLG
jgi:uncharacterized protein with NAD-binding domain and iron-sulfur cluster